MPACEAAGELLLWEVFAAWECTTHAIKYQPTKPLARLFYKASCDVYAAELKPSIRQSHTSGSF
jgi:hypothetical protein